MELTLQQLADRLDARLEMHGEAASACITGVAAVGAAQPHHVTFVNRDQFVAAAIRCRAGAVIVAHRFEEITRPQLVVPCVDSALIRALEIFAPPLKPAPPGIHPTAQVADTAAVGEGVSIGPFAVVSEDVVIRDRTVIGAGCRIGQGTHIGCDCRLDAHVVVYHYCQLGDHVIIQAGSIIGAVGFGYATINGEHRLLPHNGGVIIEDFVDVGANCCIDRAKFANTIVGSGTKIDNLVQIGHNVVIGKCCLVAGQVGIGGSTHLGDGVILAGQVGVGDNLTIGHGVRAAGKSAIVADVPDGKTMMWSPAYEQRRVLRSIVELMRLPKTVQRVKQLAKRLDKLEASEHDKG